MEQSPSLQCGYPWCTHEECMRFDAFLEAAEIGTWDQWYLDGEGITRENYAVLAQGALYVKSKMLKLLDVQARALRVSVAQECFEQGTGRNKNWKLREFLPCNAECGCYEQIVNFCKEYLTGDIKPPPSKLALKLMRDDHCKCDRETIDYREELDFVDISAYKQYCGCSRDLNVCTGSCKANIESWDDTLDYILQPIDDYWNGKVMQS